MEMPPPAKFKHARSAQRATHFESEFDVSGRFVHLVLVPGSQFCFKTDWFSCGCGYTYTRDGAVCLVLGPSETPGGVVVSRRETVGASRSGVILLRCPGRLESVYRVE